MDSYQKSVAKSCHPNPFLEKTLITGEEKIFTITIKAYLATYGNPHENRRYIYWYISCPEPWDPLLHPFRHIKEAGVRPTEIWEIIADNPLVRMTLEYIAMSDDELSPFTGNTHVVEYRAHLIEFIHRLWD